jgi:hypothetical protein
MKSKLIFILVFVSTQAFSQATDTLLKKYDQQFIYRYGSSFMKGGNKLSFGDLQNEFNSKSPSFDLYIKSRNNKTVSTVLRFVSIFAILGVLKGASDNNTGLAYGFLAGQLATALLSQHYRSKSIADLDRALQIRNRELLFPGK